MITLSFLLNSDRRNSIFYIKKSHKYHSKKPYPLCDNFLFIHPSLPSLVVHAAFLGRNLLVEFIQAHSLERSLSDLNDNKK